MCAVQCKEPADFVPHAKQHPKGHVNDPEYKRDLHLVPIEVLNAVGGGEPDRVHPERVGCARVGLIVLLTQKQVKQPND